MMQIYIVNGLKIMLYVVFYKAVNKNTLYEALMIFNCWIKESDKQIQYCWKWWHTLVEFHTSNLRLLHLIGPECNGRDMCIVNVVFE